MNSLSWLFYFAGVVEHLARVLTVMGLLGSIFYTGVCFYQGVENYNYRYWKFAWIAPLILLLSCMIPSEKALYMIAASEMGEKVYQSPDVQEIKGLIINKLKELAK